MRIDVHATPEDLAEAAADHLAELLAVAPVTFGLAGGSTPAPTYQALSRRSLDWSRVTCWLPDERWVPPDDPASNALMARRQLIDHVPAQLIAPDTTLADPGESAAAYQRLLESEFDDGPDVVLLGIGDDGHTASLFPGTEALEYKDAGYVANWVDRFGTWRLTATAPLLHHSDHLLFLVVGAAKAVTIRRILVDEEQLPARVVAEAASDVTWLLDAEAAALL
ncbi:MAG: 6-phosphogluconolactonase [Acidobacteria bacterium]|nr:6-phosphogluconolactonase [Acidobacteriota bacterium]